MSSSEEKNKTVVSLNEMDSRTRDKLLDEITEMKGLPTPTFGLTALGLHPVGMKFPAEASPTESIQMLNARGMPARIRKKNKLFFDDDFVIDDDVSIEGSPTASFQKGLVAPGKKMRTSQCVEIKDGLKKRKVYPDEDLTALLDKKTSQEIGLRLRNLLKLPKAHKFVGFEWFYSNIDRVLLDGENDFQVCLTDMYPVLTKRFLIRPVWNKIRKTMGKARRCSTVFFQKERKELGRKRHKIRLLQTKRTGDISFVRDLPKEIPQPLSVGTKVTARLRAPQDGLFTGTVEAINIILSSYRISFDRPGLGSRTIPDFEVAANDIPMKIVLKTITKDFRSRYQKASYYVTSFAQQNPSNGIKNNPLLAGDCFPKIPGTSKSKILLPKDNTDRFSIKMLELIVRTKNMLSAKQMKLQRLQNMNSEGEIYKSCGNPYPEEFQKRYLSSITAIENLNRNIYELLNQLQTSCRNLTRDQYAIAMIAPDRLREQCRLQAEETFNSNNNGQLMNGRIIQLIKNLTTIMYVASNLGTNDQTEHCIEVLKKTKSSS
ncbi:protein lin-9 homolog isoform X2 [Toxorhynchites rutilus septentrionalis]|uniref:protein lin-9 homolog isoform X2 n=1 Tax=Toxorhynchites rutilus septentrionalis TaxID=329112 RepID=UPI0024790337|nr:protein lin-9 homolog isoform X2 [Toxorhynchites rutilus septentrionalis]